MHNYQIFGGCLYSELPFPELREVNGPAADWTLRRSTGAGDVDHLDPIGEDTLPKGLKVRAFRSPTTFRLQYDDTGTFDITENGAQIRWYPGEQAVHEDARNDVLGRVLPLALHASGMLCLHGSAVALPAGGVAFLAPKYYGKSTLAMAMVARGARLITDDALPVALGARAMFRPGVHRVKLWDDSIDRLGGDRLRSGLTYERKNLVEHLAEDRVLTAEVAAAAVYVLDPVPALDGGAAAKCAQLSDVAAALALVQHAKIGSLLGRCEAAALLDHCVRLARAVPVFRLELVRDFGRLDDVVAELMRRHGHPDARPSAAGAAR